MSRTMRPSLYVALAPLMSIWRKLPADPLPSRKATSPVASVIEIDDDAVSAARADPAAPNSAAPASSEAVRAAMRRRGRADIVSSQDLGMNEGVIRAPNGIRSHWPEHHLRNGAAMSV